MEMQMLTQPAKTARSQQNIPGYNKKTRYMLFQNPNDLKCSHFQSTEQRGWFLKSWVYGENYQHISIVLAGWTHVCC